MFQGYVRKRLDQDCQDVHYTFIFSLLFVSVNENSQRLIADGCWWFPIRGIVPNNNHVVAWIVGKTTQQNCTALTNTPSPSTGVIKLSILEGSIPANVWLL